MRQRVITIAFVWSLAATAWAQAGAEITLPPNSWREGAFRFVNNCSTSEMFQVTSQPPAEWLRIAPPTVNAGPQTSFAVGVKVNTSGRNPGRYRTSLMVVCGTCAISEPPCFQSAREFPLNLTVADGAVLGRFEPIAEPAPALRATAATTPRPVLLIPTDPPKTTGLWFLPPVGLGVLAAGLIGMLWGVRSLLSPGRGVRIADGGMAAESARHRVRR